MLLVFSKARYTECAISQYAKVRSLSVMNGELVLVKMLEYVVHQKALLVPAGAVDNPNYTQPLMYMHHTCP